jgi:hypothetical protein
MGAIGAGGLAITLDAIHDDGGPDYTAIAGPSEKTYQVEEFDQISTTGPQDVVIVYGDEISVRSEGSPQALAQLEAVVEDGRLTIGPRDGFNWGNWGMLQSGKFYVTVPRLKGIAVAGSGDVKIDRVEGDSFEGKVGGSGKIDIGELKVDEADFTVNGSGSLSVVGTAREARFTVAGSGGAHAGGLRSKEASVSIFGSGNVALTVDEEAQISITGSGNADITGPGHCSVTRVGSGQARCSGGGGDEN